MGTIVRTSEDFKIGTVTLIVLYDNLNFSESAHFLNAAVRVLTFCSEDIIVLDFSNVSHIDSSGVGALISLQHTANKLKKNIYYI